MLYQINIKNFAIIDNLDLELNGGMTVITGETGAGKSIVIDALDIALGDRADHKMVKHGSDRAEINLSFDIKNIPNANDWLDDKALTSGNDCILRRIITREGRSKNYINGSPATLQQIRELGSLLVHVHGQHQHQTLLKRDEQRQLLDSYAQHKKLLIEVKSAFQQWQDTQKQIANLASSNQDHSAELTLLRYQVDELTQLNLQENEVEQLFQEQKKLSQAENILQVLERCTDLISDNQEFNLIYGSQQLQRELIDLGKLIDLPDSLQSQINDAVILLQDAEGELHHYANQIEINPERLHIVEQRLAKIHDIARKHQVKAEELLNYQQTLQTQFEQLESRDENLHKLQLLAESQLTVYFEHAQKLHEKRKKSAKKLEKLISQSIQTLGMPGGRFEVALTEETEPHPHGSSRIEFMVSANPGHPLKPLSKVASGGELARISLAIQVLTAQKDATPTLVFDEVDVGIGGGTAEIVGKLLRQLGDTAQILCITHLPQVAAQGHQHLKIDKTTKNKTTLSNLRFLNDEERIAEIARMVGGLKITKETLAHAEQMLECAEEI